MLTDRHIHVEREPVTDSMQINIKHNQAVDSAPTPCSFSKATVPVLTPQKFSLGIFTLMHQQSS